VLVFSRLPARAGNSRGVRAAELIFAGTSCASIHTFYQTEPVRQRKDLVRSLGRIGWSRVSDGRGVCSFHRHNRSDAARADARVGSTSATPILVNAPKPYEVTLQS
jgi:hypothetical protein